ncbi:LytTR family DNA-binding domain-containing protein [Mesonia sp. K7]|uniref:LytR/AlgR family response regulator transcription factor n=1 Tax=Mesonia sp. K7 TaxID=2218606 RepID=UPI000DA80C17|nr:LytTR family DNA-binding domain-containing protein [Mesonia sp. K7]PZD77939.1 DNA-binding response regulator [Mesonia sp. K7]
MKAIIIEDEKPSARRLQRMLSEIGVEVGTVLHSVNESIAWLLEHPHPDLIFLDIQLSDGISFEIFEEVPLKSAIIFTTAYDQYALKAFKLNSVDYLLKPIDEDELSQALSKFKQQRLADLPITELKNMLVHQQKSYKKRFVTKVGQHLKMFPIEEISCFYSENKGTYLHTFEGRNYLLDQPLEKLEGELNPNIFFRISRKYIIQIKAIEDMINYSNSRLQLKITNLKDNEVIVSRERVKDFKDWLAQ